MKRVAIRKLNRTQLKKEATKEIYITGKSLLDFFGYSDINQLATSRRDPKAKKEFFHKNDYFDNDTPTPFILSVTKENNEVRLTGFSEQLPKETKETDEVVLEAVDIDSDRVVYFFDVIQKNNVMVFQKLEASDDVECYEQSTNSKGVIKFALKSDAVSKHNNAYWAWDDHISQETFEQYINKPIDAVLAFKGRVVKKKIRIKSTNVLFNKLLRAQSNTNNAVEVQERELYIIQEEVADGWSVAAGINADLLEIRLDNNQVIISDRSVNSFTYYKGERA